MTDEPTKPTGVLEAVVGVAGARIKTFNEFLLAVTLMALFGITYYAMHYALPATVNSINEGHRDAREDFKAALKEDRAAQSESQTRWIEALQRERFGAATAKPKEAKEASGFAGP
jgi:hypothetical protein